MIEREFETGVIRPVECMKEGWELIKDEYWLFLGVSFVGMLIGGLIPLGLGIGAMFCGIYYVVMRKADGQKIEFGDLFKGFEWFLPGMIVTLALIIPALIAVFVMYGSMFVFIFAAVGSNGKVDDAVVVSMFAAFAVEMIIVSLITGSIHALIMFSYPLIVERNLDGMSALKLGARAAWANLSGVVGIILVEFAMGIIGYLLFIVGVYLMLPIMFAGVFVAYRKVFPQAQRFNAPPAPGFYQGL